MVDAHVSRRGLLVGAGALAASAAVAGCGGNSSEAAPGSAAKGPRTGNGTYVEVLAFAGNPYFFDHKLGIETAGKELGVETQFLGPADFDLEKMLQTMDETIARKPSGILVVGFDPRLKGQIEKALEADIPVIGVDADLPGAQWLSFLGTGNPEAGRLGGTELARQLGNTGKVLLLTVTGQHNLDERIRGYREVLESSGIEVVAVANDKGDPTVAASAVSAALRKHPDLAGVGAVAAAGGAGAATALKEAGKTGQVKIVSMDRDAENLQGIEEGAIQASVAQQTALMTYLGIKLLHQYQTSNLEITSDNTAAGLTGLPPYVNTGTTLITKDNVQYFKRGS